MKVEEWISRNGMYGKVTLMYDHATQHSGYFIANSGMLSISPTSDCCRVSTSV